MKITLTNIGKRYNQHWIFKNINYEFVTEDAYVILGANGSGKSTLLQVLAGNLDSSEGTISFSDKNGIIDPENIYSKVSIVAPYLELLEAYTLKELVDFHFQFKEFYPGVTSEKFIELIGLESGIKKLKEFSSGMKQRVKLALAILSNSPILLLDEPASNLDKKGVEWYNQLVLNHRKDRLLIVCSNQLREEYAFCSKELPIENYK